MKISKDEKELQKAASAILSFPEFYKKLPNDIVSRALITSKDETFKKEKATCILKEQDWKKIEWSIVFQSLYSYCNEANAPKFIVEIIDSIISENFNPSIKIKGKYYRYINIMKIPFHNIPSWERSNEINISNWRNLEPVLLINTLWSNRNHPSKIKTICSVILINWMENITIEIPQSYGESHFGDSIRISLGHPKLKQEALKTAREIEKISFDKPEIIPEYLIDIVDKIIYKNIYPEWVN